MKYTLTALLTAIAAFLFCISLFLPRDIASADGTTATYSISYDDGVYKIICGDGKVVYSSEVFDGQAANTSILNDFSLKDYSDYILSIAPPSVSLSFKDGIDSMPYNEKGGDIRISAQVSHPLQGSVGVDGYRWYYKNKNEQQYSQSFGSVYSSFVFGQSVAAGTYDVKAEADFVFVLGEKSVTVTGRAQTSCAVTVNDEFDLGELPVPDAISYGSPLSAIVLNDSRGIWCLSDEIDPNAVLSVGIHTLKFDFTPNNQNYLPLKGLEITVTVSAYPIRILIHSKSSVKGQPLKQLTFELLTQNLPDGDGIDDLNISLAKEEGDEAGVYTITGVCGNAKYAAVFVNPENPDSIWNIGGIYTVFPDTVSAQLQNGAKINLKNAEGFSFTARLELFLREDGLPDIEIADAYSLGGYDFRITDGGAAVAPEGLCSIEISGLPSTVKYVLYFDAALSEWKTTEAVGGRVVFETQSPIRIHFVGIDAEDLAADWNWATVFLACFAAALIIAELVLWKKYLGGKK